MKLWSEIKAAALNKLFLEESEAQEQGYLAKFQYLANECLNIIANGVKPKIASFTVTTTSDMAPATMPDDFLSFAGMTNYYYKLNDSGDVVDTLPDADVIYVTDKQIILPKKGKYIIYYNALWNEITDDDVRNDNANVLNIDSSVLNCIPTYIASQLLSQDDPQRSAILKNEFELMLSRLDTTIMYQEQHFKSPGGWY